MAVPAERHEEHKEPRVSDLTLPQLRLLVNQYVSEALEEIVEDTEALQSAAFVQSIREARAQYREGNTKSLEQVFGDA